MRIPEWKVKLLALNCWDDGRSNQMASGYGYYLLRAHALADPVLRESTLIHVAMLPHAFSGLDARSLVDPDVRVLGLSCHGWSVEWIERIIPEARAVNPDVRIWIGGSGLALLLERDRVEWSVRDLLFTGTHGSTEEPFRQTLARLVGTGDLDEDFLAAQPGIAWWRQDGSGPVRNPPADYVPLARLASPFSVGLPPFDPVQDYFPLRTSEGCPQRCRYCAVNRIIQCGTRYDFAPMERLAGEMEIALREGARHLHVRNNALNFTYDHFSSVIDLIPARQFSDVHVVLLLGRFDARHAARVLREPPGVFEFKVGVQSLSAAACRAARRPLYTIDTIRERIAPLAGHSRVDVDYMFPLPGETYDEFRANIEALLATPNVSVTVNQLTLTPDLEFGNQIDRWGFQVEDIGGMRYARSCNGFAAKEVEAAQDWLRSLGARNLSTILDSRRWREEVSRGSSTAGRDATAAHGMMAIETSPGLAKHSTLCVVVADRQDAASPSTFFLVQAEAGGSYFLEVGGIGIWYSRCDSADLLASVTQVLADAIRRTPGPITPDHWDTLLVAIETSFSAGRLPERYLLSCRMET